MNTCAEVGYRQGRKKGGGGGRKRGGGRRGEGRSVAAQQQQRGLTYRDLYSPAHPAPPPLPGEPDDYKLLGGDVPLVAMAIECQSRAREGGRES